MNDDPWPAFGGKAPVVDMRNASMIVVFPHPFDPRMRVSGVKNLIVCDIMYGYVCPE